MLVSFEGQDGAGKTALLRAVHQALGHHGVAAVALGEFSDSPYGQALVESVRRDKFLRPVAGEAATALTRALEIVADLYYFDERVVAPVIGDAVVLKDRHIDTILYTLTPTLIRSGALSGEQETLAWLRGLCVLVRHPPDLTIYVDASPAVRQQRIERRQRQLAEARGNEVSAEDREIFDAREQILRQLVADDPDRFLVMHNAHQSIQKGASQIVEAIRSRLAATPQGGRQHG